jgi:hypothetical protein
MSKLIDIYGIFHRSFSETTAYRKPTTLPSGIETESKHLLATDYPATW